jgi:hypothetical protein
MYSPCALLMAVLGVTAGADPPATKPEPGSVVVASLVWKEAFVLTVTPADLKRTPPWAGDATEPPLSALKIWAGGRLDQFRFDPSAIEPV